VLFIIRCRIFCLRVYHPKNLKTKFNIVLPVVLCRCETWSLTLREERRLKVFEDRVLRKILVPKRQEVTGE